MRDHARAPFFRCLVRTSVKAMRVKPLELEMAYAKIVFDAKGLTSNMRRNHARGDGADFLHFLILFQARKAKCI